MKFRPCIDIQDGRPKQIVGSTIGKDQKTNFDSDKPADYYAALYKRDGLTGGHVIMLDRKQETKEAAISAIETYPNGLQIGGGINPENAYYFLEKGASHVIVTSYVFKDGRINFENLDKLIKEVGEERLVLDLSCRAKEDRYFVVTDRWQKFTEYQITKENLDRLSKYCSEFLIHGADVEGKCKGIQEDLVRNLGDWVNIQTTYAGGARSLLDMDIIDNLGKGKLDLTIGSALDIFGGNLPYKEVISWVSKK